MSQPKKPTSGKIHTQKIIPTKKEESTRTQYRYSRIKNTFRALFLGISSLGIITILALFTLQKVGNIDLKFDILKLLANTQLVDDILPQERINVLIAGIWGAWNDAPHLTDSIIVGSIDFEKWTVSLLSIPRDLYVRSSEFWDMRINEIYARSLRRFGSKRALQDLSDIVEEITDQDIEYVSVVDFTGFEKFIDLLGGVTIDVPESIYDTTYPDNNWWYETFSIQKGTQTLNGSTALKYARSRHTTSDFDRSTRQQLIVRAIKSRLLDTEILTSPEKIKSLYATIRSHINTNLSTSEMIAIALKSATIDVENIVSFNLNDTCFQSYGACYTGGFLYTPIRELFAGKAVLLPNTATADSIHSYEQIQKFAYLIFELPEIFNEPYTIRIFNSTKQPGLAWDFAKMLRQYGFQVPRTDAIFTLRDEALEKTTIYYNSTIPPESKTLEGLGMFLFGEQIPDVVPKYTQSHHSDIEIVLWKDAYLFLEN